LNISAKIHSIKHYFFYAYYSKTKYKIHSPFVFNFICTVLEPSQTVQPKLPEELLNYYIKYKQKINISDNAGEGSNAIDYEHVTVSKIISKIGIPKKYGKILLKIIEKYKCKTVIELGTSLGISTSYLAEFKQNKVYTIDANQEIQDISKEAFKAININNVIFINASFEDSFESLCQGQRNISLIFIDGNHNKDATIRYFNTCLPYINEETIIIFDDIYWSEGMTEAWQFICQHHSVRLSIDLYRIGIIFFRKEQKRKEHFILWH
jgi:predicted O-methyltransferase YrrM